MKNAIAIPILNNTTNLIKNEVDEMKENLLIGYEKMTLPRPEELGNK